MSSKMEELERRGYKGYAEDGSGQVVDGTPVRLPVGFTKVDNFANRVREIVRGERLRAEMEAAQMETFEEADDFDVADDPIDPSTPYEADFDFPTPAELKKRAKKERKSDDVRGVGKGSKDAKSVGGAAGGDTADGDA